MAHLVICAIAVWQQQRVWAIRARSGIAAAVAPWSSGCRAVTRVESGRGSALMESLEMIGLMYSRVTDNTMMYRKEASRRAAFVGSDRFRFSFAFKSLEH